MQVVTGYKIHRDGIAHVVRSPALPRRKPESVPACCSRNFFTRFIAITCSGGPDMYISSSLKTPLVILHDQRVAELHRQALAVRPRDALKPRDKIERFVDCKSFSNAGG